MEEKGRKRRDWVKNAAIIFLSVMLVLTFFSNTIMNYSLPEVATQYAQPGNITAKIRGTGTIESGDPYEIHVKETRKVTSVAVRTGDYVQKGDVLFYLEDSDSEELKNAKAALDAAQDAYDQKILQNISNSSYTSSGLTTAQLKTQITNLQTQLHEAQDKVTPLQKQYDSITQQIADCDAQLTYENAQNSQAVERAAAAANALAVAQANADKAKTALTNAEATAAAKETAVTTAQTNVTNAETALASAQSSRDTKAAELAAADPDDTATIDTLTAELATLEGEVTTAQNNKAAADAALATAQSEKTAADTAVATAQTNKNTADAALVTAQTNKTNADAAVDNRNSSTVSANVSSQRATLELSRYSVEKDLTAAKQNVTDIETSLQTLAGTIMNISDLEDLQKNINNARKTYNEILATVKDASITSDINGKVVSLNVTAGQTTTPGYAVATLQPEGSGCTLSFSVTNDQAKQLSIGDRADLVNAWRYDDVTVVLNSIKPDRQEPGQKKLLTFTVTGDVYAGQTLNVSVGQRSANYDIVIPNSAIREDNNGKFVLTIEAKSSPLGNRYIATRADIEVIASDDNQSAVRGALSGYEYVITTASKPVSAGQQVRFNE